MRILAVADIHGKEEKIFRLKDNVIRHSPHLVVVAGDITGFFGQALPVLCLLNEIGTKVVMVRGNTDRKSMHKDIQEFPNLTLLEQETFTMEGIRFAGISGAFPLPFRTRIRMAEKGLFQDMEKIVDKETILIAHPPPYGTLDLAGNKFHAGSKSLSAFIRKKQPLMVICGHIHESPGVENLGQTTIVNCACAGTDMDGVCIDTIQGFPPETRVLKRQKND